MKNRATNLLILSKPTNRLVELPGNDEVVPDERYQFRPSEVVQRKLQLALPSNHVPISLLHLHRLVRR